MGDTLEVRGDDPPSTWRLGNGGLDWNAQTPDPVPDADITSQGAELVLLAGADNDDAIGARGGPGVGAPFTAAPLQISGGPGDDTLEGGDSTTAFLAPGDTLIGDEGDDTLRGFAGDDRLDQGPGDDTMVGGVGTDSVEFSDAPAGVTVDLGRTTQQNTGDGLDAISEVEQAYGSDASDTLIGDGGPNHLAGRGGDDTLDGRASADSLIGGAGTDVVSFEEAPTGVVADLTAGTATGGAGADSLVDLENIVGSPFADTLTGNALDNSIVGLGGTDSISALAGADTVDVRDGEADIASCGSDLDTATADLQTLDTVDADCETVDFLRDEAIELTLTAKAKQRIARRRAVVVRVACPLEACTATASAGGKIRGGGRLKLGPVTATVPAGAEQEVALALTKAQRRKVKRALRAGKAPRLTVTATATDAAGNAATKTVRVRAKR